jgi:two-component system cell cycle response regulator DivK
MSGETILIVEDNPANLELSRRVLVLKGYDVLTVVDAEEALAVLQTLRPRLILLDLQLPGMDGLELTRRLKADPATRSIIIVALTAYAMKGDEQRGRDAGCDGFIVKPFDIIALADAVAAFLTSP